MADKYTGRTLNNLQFLTAKRLAMSLGLISGVTQRAASTDTAQSLAPANFADAF